MVTRRAFLTGGAATVVLAAAGVEVVGPDRILREIGLRSSPDHRAPPSDWRVEEASLRSAHVEGRTPWAMARPPGDEALTGAIICLHGHGGTHRFAFDAVHLHDVVAEAGERIGVAAVDGRNQSYWHERDDGTNTGRMVLDEFVPLVRERMQVERLAITGWSMGGYGTLLLAEQSPDTFAAVVASSAALWLRAGDSAPGAFDDAEDFAAHDVFAMRDRLDVAKTRIDCGDKDWFIEGNRAFVAALGPEVTSSFPPGYHDVPFWRSVAPAQVAFIAERLRA
jgi:pimeloyl-ACP methyl ester carboxylesterase